MTSKQSKGPNRDWLDFVQTAQARHRIKSFLRKQVFEDSVRVGHDRLERAARAEHIDPKLIIRHEILEKLAPQHNSKSSDELLAAIGYGDISAERILEKIRAELKRDEPVEAPAITLPKRKRPRHPTNGQGRLAVSLAASGVDDVMFTVARCCAPVPGDRVAGYVTRGRGVTLHRLSCRNLHAYQQREPDRIMEVEWQLSDDASFNAEIAVEAFDKVGLLNEITGLISERKVNIETLHTETGKDKRARMNIVLSVPHLERLTRVLEDLRNLPSVIDAYRVAGSSLMHRSVGAP